MAKRKNRKKSSERSIPSTEAPALVITDVRHSSLAKGLMWAFVTIVVLFFLVMKSFSFHWQIGDENVYFYMAWATLDHGALPYRDYFFAHPPLHLLPGLPVFWVFGFSPVTVRIVPVAATLTSAFFLMSIARKKIGYVAAGAIVFVMLTSFSLLRASTHWTGINLAMMWISVGLFFLVRKRHAAAGVLFALGVCTGNYVLPGAVMAALLAALDSRRSLLRFFVGFIVPWSLIQVLGLLVGGEAYIDSVYRYHFLKPTKKGISRQMFFRVATDNFLLHLGAVLAPVLAWLDPWLARQLGKQQPPESSSKEPVHEWPLLIMWTWFKKILSVDSPHGLARIGALWALGYLLFIAVIPRVFPFYFLLAFPGLALASAYSAERLWVYVRELFRTIGKRPTGWSRALMAICGVIVSMVLAFALRVPLQRSLLPHYNRSRPVPMVWSDSPLPVNGLMRWCCWDDVAEPGKAYGTIQEVLYHESRYFEKPQELAQWLRQHSSPKQRLFGDSSTAGLVAILADRRLAGDFADTNTMRFVSGISPARDVIHKIDTNNLGFVLVKERRFRDRAGKIQTRYGKFASLPEFRKWLAEKFKVVFRVKDRTKGSFAILGRTATAPVYSSR